MRKQAISVTLEADNLAWVRGRALAAGRVSVSEMLDRLIADARTGGRGGLPEAQSAVGTVTISPEDPATLPSSRTTWTGSRSRSPTRRGRTKTRSTG